MDRLETEQKNTVIFCIDFKKFERGSKALINWLLEEEAARLQILSKLQSTHEHCRFLQLVQSSTKWSEMSALHIGELGMRVMESGAIESILESITNKSVKDLFKEFANFHVEKGFKARNKLLVRFWVEMARVRLGTALEPADGI